MKSWSLIVVALALAAQPGLANADETPGAGAVSAPARERAAHAFAEGEKAFSAGEYSRAAKLFEEAFAARPHPSALLNAAKARRLAGHFAQAANHFRRVETESTSPPRDIEEAKAALAELTPNLGRVIVRTGSGVSSAAVDGNALRGSETFVDPGDHIVEAAPSIRKMVHVNAGETSTVALDRAPASTSSAASPGPILTHEREQEREREHERAIDRETVTSVKPIAPWMTFTGVAATLIVGGITIWSGVDTMNQRDDWDAAPSNRSLDIGLEKQQRTNILIGVTSGLAILTGVLAVFTEWHRASPSPPRPVQKASPSSPSLPSTPSTPSSSFAGGGAFFGNGFPM